MSMKDIKRAFPSLDDHNCQRKSDQDFNYNCLAFVLGDLSNWWEPPGEFGFYWPPGFSDDLSVDTVVEIIKLHGFVLDVDRKSRPKADAIAIYAKGDEWTH